MINVLVSGLTSNVGGVETFLMNYYRRVNSTKFHFDFWCHYPTMAFEDEVVKKGSLVYHGCARSKNPLHGYLEIQSFFHKHAHKYNAIWSNKNTLTNVDDLKFALKYGIPKRIIHSHNVLTEGNGTDARLRDFLHKRHRKIISTLATDFWACSNSSADWFYSDDKHIRFQCKQIHNAIDVKQFSFNMEIRDRYRCNFGLEGSFVVGHIGRFQPQKNHEFLIDIFQKICQIRPNAHLLLAGSGELEPIIKEKVHNLSLEQHVHFLGMRNDIPQLMQAMDVFLLPSLFEGFPLVLVEAQAAGLPCVISDSITDEVKLTSSTVFMNLASEPEIWAKVVCSQMFRNNDCRDDILKTGYDIDSQVKILENYLTH